MKKDSSFITIITGENTDDEATEKIVEQLQQKLSDTIEINVIPGGQPVYHYIISVE